MAVEQAQAQARLRSGETLYIETDAARARALAGLGALTALDDRSTGNPSFCIYDSYRVTRRARRREILEALINYDAAHPTTPAWGRTLRSLEREWVIHNVAYRLGLFRSHARHVDLDNREEGKGWLHYILRGAAVIRARLKKRFSPNRRTAE